MTTISIPFVECSFVLLQPALLHAALSIDCIRNRPVVLSRHQLGSRMLVSFDITSVKKFALPIRKDPKGQMTSSTERFFGSRRSQLLVNEIVQWK